MHTITNIATISNSRAFFALLFASSNASLPASLRAISAPLDDIFECYKYRDMSDGILIAY